MDLIGVLFTTAPPALVNIPCLAAEQNGWQQEPRVLLNVRRPFTDQVELRKESEWPLKRTNWTKLYLDAEVGALAWHKPGRAGTAAFIAGNEHICWLSPPLEQETEITGPLSLTLYISSSTEDADLFVTLQAFSPEGTEVKFAGTVDPNTPLAQGWLRASHRKLCEKRSFPYQPFHAHDDKQPLKVGEIYEVVIEIWPTCIVLPAGYQLALDIRGSDFARDKGPDGPFPYRGSGPWLHDDPSDRPKSIYGGTTTVHTGPGRECFLLMPVIPARK